MPRVIIIACLLMVIVCWATWTLRAASSGRELGRPPRGAVIATIDALRRSPGTFAGKTIAVSGQLTQRCPTAGCWFYLNDGTGDLRVDARPGSFSVLGLPIGARLTVYGRLVREPGEDLQFAAVGARS
jgi:hypothetical protein